jgi:hypothetical protein
MKNTMIIFALFCSIGLQASTVAVDSIPTCIEWTGDPALFDSLAGVLGFLDVNFAFDTLTFELYRDSLGTTIDTVDVYQLRIVNDTGEINVQPGECVIRQINGLLSGRLDFYNEIKRIYLASLPE